MNINELIKQQNNLIEDDMSDQDAGVIENDDNTEETDIYGPVKFDDINSLLDANVTYNTMGIQIVSILNNLENGYFVIPGFQRRYVWKKEKVAYLALSIIKNFPIPPLYLYIDPTSKRKQVVLDGQQRMIAIFLYFNELTYVRSDNHINFKEVSILNREIRELENKKQKLEFESAMKKEVQAIGKEIKEKSAKLLDTYGMKRCHYTVMTDQDMGGSRNEMDISFSLFDDDSKTFLLSKNMDITIVGSADTKPQKTYANLFKLLNSAGKILGTQEIRNGIYWESTLYKELYQINEKNHIWRKIYGNISIYSKDMEILLKSLALFHYTKINEKEKLEVDFKGFSWAAIMDEYSCDFQTGEEVFLIEHFLNNIQNYESGRKCTKAIFEAMFVAYSILCREKDYKIDYEWLCDQAKKLGEIKSSKGSVEERLNIAYKELKEKLNEGKV